MNRRLLGRLRADRRGATVIEFAIVAPVMLLVLMGLGDLLYQPYLQALLEGSMQKAGRDSALEDGVANAAAVDKTVQDMVSRLAPRATFTPLRKSYSSFALVKPETIYDTNKNGKLDKNECYDDVNGNGKWDADPGRTGQGGADDVTSYTMTVTYPRLFPVSGLLGLPTTQTVSASTLLKNQPYKTQTVHEIKRPCL